MSIRSFALTAATSVALIAAAGAAGAADLDSGYGFKGSIKDAPYMAPVATTPSWYVRLDGSYAQYDTPVLVEQGIDTLTESDISNNWAFGGGIGRYFTQNIRGDLTYERRFETDVQGNLDHPGATLPGTRRFGMTSDVFLANLYYDFDADSRFTPYLGVGLGFARHSTKDGTVDTCGCTTGVIDGADKWTTAGALMAGASVKMFRGFHLDAGYRFLYLGEAETGAVRITDAPGRPGVSVSDDPVVEHLHAHEFRVGLRYDFR